MGRKNTDTMSVEDFLGKYFYKDEIQSLCKKAGLYHKGPKSELIDRLINESDYTTLDYLNYCNKEGLKEACEDLGEYKSGRKEDIIKRLLPHFDEDIVEFIDEEDDIIYEKEIKTPNKIKKRGTTDINPNDIINIIEEWEPDRRYQNESGYKAELYQYFKYNFEYKIRQEMGKSKTDILVGDNIAIEIKKNPNSPSYDRMHTQLVKQKKEFGYSIGLIFDVKNRDSFEDFLELMDDYDNIHVIRK